MTAATSERVASDWSGRCGCRLGGRGADRDPAPGPGRGHGAVPRSDRGGVVVALHEPASGDERAANQRLAPLIRAAVMRRPDLVVLLCGPDQPLQGGLPAERAAGCRRPTRSRSPRARRCATRCRRSQRHGVDAGSPDSGDGLLAGDPRDASRLTGCRMPGWAFATRSRRWPRCSIGGSRPSRSATRRVPAPLLSRDAWRRTWSTRTGRSCRDARSATTGGRCDLRWSAIRRIRSRSPTALRNLRLAPWRDAAATVAAAPGGAARGARRRLDAAMAVRRRHGPGRRAARVGRPARLQWRRVRGRAAAGRGARGRGRDAPPGCAQPVPRSCTGARAAGHAPRGRADRRRLLADLLDDALLPLGERHRGERHATGRPARGDAAASPASCSSTSRAGTGRAAAGDLPPGVPARIEVEPREGPARRPRRASSRWR